MTLDAILIADASGLPRPAASNLRSFRRCERDRPAERPDGPRRPPAGPAAGRATSLILAGGAVDEPADMAGATILAARALTEGTARDTTRSSWSRRPSGSARRSTPRPAGTRSSVSVDVPADRLGAALDLLAEVLRTPTFPDG